MRPERPRVESVPPRPAPRNRSKRRREHSTERSHRSRNVDGYDNQMSTPARQTSMGATGRKRAWEETPHFLGMYGHIWSHATVLEARPNAGLKTFGEGWRGDTRRRDSASPRARRRACPPEGARNSPSRVCAQNRQMQHSLSPDARYYHRQLRKVALGAMCNRRTDRAQRRGNTRPADPNRVNC